ncbi:aspartate racemase [Rhodothermaceae bacterium RA]|nr:aspartate racemase [Rhodothermaceae bacterium RA]
MPSPPLIGVIGGMGPYAGLHLTRKIFEHTRAQTDQEHLPVALLSLPNLPDRTAYLLGQDPVNPAVALADVAARLDDLGAAVAGMACNTAHAPAIFDVIVETLHRTGRSIRLLHMIEETARHTRALLGAGARVGVLATLGTYRFRLYQEALQAAGLVPVVPDEPLQEPLVHRSIYDPQYGIKARSHPVSPMARQGLLSAITHLKQHGARAIILGCTELPLAFPEPEVQGLPLIDPSDVLARALIRATCPDRLRE